MRKNPWRGRFARRFHPWMLNGFPGDISTACKRFVLRAVRAGLIVTATTNGVHAPTSYHFSGRAVDVGLPAKLIGTTRGQKRMGRFQRKEALHPERFNELFGPLRTLCVKDGRRLVLAEGSALESLHDNHVHGAPKR